MINLAAHPYHTGFLDTWTQLSYVAALTERIGLSGNGRDGLALPVSKAGCPAARS
jgi:alkanesulfonate monooxygenase SsuD/methylene tetrahydromethanopterin reductase-like flavin-dependent oxidoreductase (luciferase family)